MPWRAATVVLIALAMLGVPWVAGAQTTPPIPMHTAPMLPPHARHSDQQPLPWHSLNPAQQRLLAPLRDGWSRQPPERQHRLAQNSVHWATLPDAHQDRIRARLARWANMTPAERRQLRDNARAFHALPAAERARISAAFRHFQSLPPAQQRALRARWRQRHGHAFGRAPAAHPAPIPMHAPPAASRH